MRESDSSFEFFYADIIIVIPSTTRPSPEQSQSQPTVWTKELTHYHKLADTNRLCWPSWEASLYAKSCRVCSGLCGPGRWRWPPGDTQEAAWSPLSLNFKEWVLPTMCVSLKVDHDLAEPPNKTVAYLGVVPTPRLYLWYLDRECCDGPCSIKLKYMRVTMLEIIITESLFWLRVSEVCSIATWSHCFSTHGKTEYHGREQVPTHGSQETKKQKEWGSNITHTPFNLTFFHQVPRLKSSTNTNSTTAWQALNLGP